MSTITNRHFSPSRTAFSHWRGVVAAVLCVTVGVILVAGTLVPASFYVDTTLVVGP